MDNPRMIEPSDPRYRMATTALGWQKRAERAERSAARMFAITVVATLVSVASCATLVLVLVVGVSR